MTGSLVQVENGGYIRRSTLLGPDIVEPIGNASADNDGDFLFQPGIGGDRMDIAEHPDANFVEQFIQASRFGEVNTYFHLDRMARYVRELLVELHLPVLPQIRAVVNAHCGVKVKDLFDGVRRQGRLVGFQGGHYRLPSSRFDLPEHDHLSQSGEIHIGPGRQILPTGALAEYAGTPYRANASHNAGIIYHEYGHHVCRHVADFRGNSFVDPLHQDNRKTALDEGTCDYFAAAMLGSPHIWAFHQCHDETSVHPRSLVSNKTFADFDHSQGADPHTNGTIWGAALWRLRSEINALEDEGGRSTDKLVLQTLAILGSKLDSSTEDVVKAARRARKSYVSGLGALLDADDLLFSGRHAESIRRVFSKAGIDTTPLHIPVLHSVSVSLPVLKRIPSSEMPETEDLLTSGALSRHIDEAAYLPFSAIFAGDLMLGGRASEPIEEFGADYPFEAVRPLLRHSDVVCANLEGPFARKAKQQDRNYSYKVDPDLSHSLSRAGVNVVSLANNHIQDCGSEGIIETFSTLKNTNISWIGAGMDRSAAHIPHIFRSYGIRIGLLSYYWNSRTAANDLRPGCAVGDANTLERDLGLLKQVVDRAVVIFHWGLPYERQPFEEDRDLARLAVDLGADLVIGHHPHVIQPFEVYRDVPIFYSVGNFAFGSGNSRGEGMLVATCFMEDRLSVNLFPLSVKNRDPRVNYQPKVLGGQSGNRILMRLAEQSGDSGRMLEISGGCAQLTIEHRFRCHAGGVHA